MVARLNHGLDIGGQSIGAPTRFHIGVGVNPFAPNPDAEWRRLDAQGRGRRGVHRDAADSRRRRVRRRAAAAARRRACRSSPASRRSRACGRRSSSRAKSSACASPTRLLDRLRGAADEAAEALAMTLEIVAAAARPRAGHSDHVACTARRTTAERLLDGAADGGRSSGRQARVTCLTACTAPAGASTCCCSATFSGIRGTVGAVAPSSRVLAREMVRALDAAAPAARRRARTGHGLVHRARSSSGCGRATRFSPSTSIRRSSSSSASAGRRSTASARRRRELAELARARDFGPVDHIVSGLPFASLPAAMTRQILDAIRARAAARRHVHDVSVRARVHAAARRGLPARRRAHGSAVRASRSTVFRNIPPAFVLTLAPRPVLTRFGRPGRPASAIDATPAHRTPRATSAPSVAIRIGGAAPP